jgi:hypothetical protein
MQPGVAINREKYRELSRNSFRMRKFRPNLAIAAES